MRGTAGHMREGIRRHPDGARALPLLLVAAAFGCFAMAAWDRNGPGGAGAGPPGGVGEQAGSAHAPAAMGGVGAPAAAGQDGRAGEEPLFERGGVGLTGRAIETLGVGDLVYVGDADGRAGPDHGGGQPGPGAAGAGGHVSQAALGDGEQAEAADVPGFSLAAEHVDPATWRRVKLRLAKASGGSVTVELLRPLAWLRSHRAAAGWRVHLALPELGAVGPATVLQTGPCPEIPAVPPGCAVVTGTFAHGSVAVVDLRLVGTAETELRSARGPPSAKPAAGRGPAAAPRSIGVTATHPIWSEDRQAYVPAGDVQPGERLWALAGPATVESVAPLPGRHAVYNLEVAGRHVYHVSADGILVHNNCLRANLRAAGLWGKADDIAHHIVPQGAFSRYGKKLASALARAREVLADHGIGIHSHWNGMMLSPKVHRNLHTKGYIMNVAERIIEAGQSGRVGVLRELQKIRSRILLGLIK